MIGNPKWNTAVLAAAVIILIVGTLAWVFPRETTAVAGPWALSALSLSALFLALGLAVEWRLLRGLLMALAFTLVLGWNRSSVTSTSHFTGACLGFLVMLTIARAVTTPSRLRLAVLTFLAGGMVVLLLGLAGGFLQPGTPLVSKLPGQLPTIQLGLAGLGPLGYVNSNALAAATLLVVPLGVSVLVLGTGEKTDWLGLLPVGLAVVVTGTVTVVICRSRSAWVAIWLILVGLFVRGTRSWLSRIIVAAIVISPLLVAAGSILFLSQETFVTEARHIWVSAQDRAQVMTTGAERWKESPWLGMGLNEFRSLYPSQVAGTGDIAHVHNIFLQTALDVGAIGSVAYWGLMAFLLVRAGQTARGRSRLGRSAAVGSALSLVAVNLFGLLDAVPLGSKIGMLQWISSGLILAAWRMRSVVSFETPRLVILD